VRSWWLPRWLSFRRPFCFGSLQFSNPCGPAGGDPRASSPTCGSPKERPASLALPPLRPILVGCVVAILVRLAAMSADGSARRLPGRPEVASNIRDLIRRMSQANPLWGAPRIHGELLKLGIAVAQSTVTQYLPRRRKPPSQTWPSRRAGGAPGSEWLRHSGERGRSWNGTPSSLPGESRSGPQRIQDHRTVLARSRPMTGCHTHNSESERRKPL